MRSRAFTEKDFSMKTYVIALAQQMDAARTLEGRLRFQIAIIVLTATNLAAAVLMNGNILYDAWTMRQRDF